MGRDVALTEENHFVRIEPEGKVVHRDFMRHGSQFVCVTDGCERVEVSNEDATFVVVLHGNVIFDGTQVVAEVRFPTRLNARKNNFFLILSGTFHGFQFSRRD